MEPANLPPLEETPPFVSMRIVSIDHYMTYPNRLLDHCTTQFSAPGIEGFRVPVVRMFGVTAAGQKACVHLHNAYRYIYIPYEGPSDPEQAQVYIHKLGTSLNHATALAFGKHPEDAGKNLFIASIVLVKGVPFYGFHPGYRPFLKINLLNPSHVKRVCVILESGSVLGTQFQPHEAHLPYLHQLFIDYNLYGMDFIHFAEARFRMPILDVPHPGLEAHDVSTPKPSFFREKSIPDHYKWPSRYNISRQSYCELEIDAWVGDIMNRDRIKERAHIPLPLGAAELDGTKLVPSLEAIWNDEQNRRNLKNITKPLSDNYTPHSGRHPYSPWSNEARLRSELDRALETNRSNDPHQSDLSDERLKDVQTAFGSVPCWHPTEATVDNPPVPLVISRELSFADFTSSQEYSPSMEHLSVMVDVDRITQAFASQHGDANNQPPGLASEQEFFGYSDSDLLNIALDADSKGNAPTPRQSQSIMSVLDEPFEDEDPVMEQSDDSEFDDLSIPELDDLVIYDDPPTPRSPASTSSPTTPGRSSNRKLGPSPLRRALNMSPTPGAWLNAASSSPASSSPLSPHPTATRHGADRSQSAQRPEDHMLGIENTHPPRGEEFRRRLAEEAVAHHIADPGSPFLDDPQWPNELRKTTKPPSLKSDAEDVPSRRPPPRRLPQLDGGADSPPHSTERGSMNRYSDDDEIESWASPAGQGSESSTSSSGPDQIVFFAEREASEPGSSPNMRPRKKRRREVTFSSSPPVGGADDGDGFYYDPAAQEQNFRVRPANSFECVEISPLKQSRSQYQYVSQEMIPPFVLLPGEKPFPDKLESPSRVSGSATNSPSIKSPIIAKQQHQPHRNTSHSARLPVGNSQPAGMSIERTISASSELMYPSHEVAKAAPGVAQPVGNQQRLVSSALSPRKRRLFIDDDQEMELVTGDKRYPHTSLPKDPSSEITPTPAAPVLYSFASEQLGSDASGDMFGIPSTPPLIPDPSRPPPLSLQFDTPTSELALLSPDRGTNTTPNQSSPLLYKHQGVERDRREGVDDDSESDVRSCSPLDKRDSAPPLQRKENGMPAYQEEGFPIINFLSDPEEDGDDKPVHTSLVSSLTTERESNFSVESWILASSSQGAGAQFGRKEDADISSGALELDSGDEDMQMASPEILALVHQQHIVRTPPRQRNIANFRRMQREASVDPESPDTPTKLRELRTLTRPPPSRHRPEWVQRFSADKPDPDVQVVPLPSQQSVPARWQGLSPKTPAKQTALQDSVTETQTEGNNELEVTPTATPLVHTPMTLMPKQLHDRIPSVMQTPAQGQFGLDPNATWSFSKMPREEAVDTPSHSPRTGVSSHSSTPMMGLRPLHASATQSPRYSNELLGVKPAGDNNVIQKVFRAATSPPTTDELLASLDAFDIPHVVYREPYYSDPRDVPNRTRVWAGREFKFKSTEAVNLPEFEAPVAPDGAVAQVARGIEHWRHVKFDQGVPTNIRLWRPGAEPPSSNTVAKWLHANKLPDHSQNTGTAWQMSDTPVNSPNPIRSLARKANMVSQVEAPTQKNPYGFKYSQINTKTVTTEQQFVCLLSMELHATSQGDLLPNPEIDPIRALFYCLQQDDHVKYPTNGHREGYYVGIIMVEDAYPLSKTGIGGCHLDIVADEKTLIELFLYKVRSFDPDFLVGYEIHMTSWGYLIERARYAHTMDVITELSRVIPEDANTKFGSEEDAWGSRKQSHLQTTGRNFLNVWRLLRNEMTLTSYTLENTAYHVLHIRIPKYTSRTLTEWYENGMLYKWRTVKYYTARVQYNIDLLEDIELISRTSEFARVFGIDFFSVLTRGSQYKVESIMARIAKPENYILITPSPKQVAQQRACECLPLVMEPQSRFYASPLLVLDFQSLYPSIMIAYNYCYSTCLGRVQTVGKPGKLGVINDYQVSAEFVEMYKDHLNISPNGLAFVKANIRESTLKRMLAEILDTRVMVKQSMKMYKSDKSLIRILEARQLGLKYIANVTYGYTGASFSGRMPCVEIADAIVQTGRATLEKGIELINNTKRWGAKVVYGDTDSLFVHLPGISKALAFKVGQEIVDTITSLNPEPVKLKFEKVYHPCVLLAKKRYVGFKYESPEDVEPVFDAKGIETVRRDGCAAVVKSMEQCLKMLFRSQDLSEVKRYCHRQWAKILSGRVSLQDFIIAKEVHLGSYSDRGPPPPGALVSTRKMTRDHRAEPQQGERVPYVVVYGGPGYRLIDSVVPPEELLASKTLRLHGTYYIQKQIIPALSRVFNLVGADVESWFNEMPKVQRAIQFTPSQLQPDVRTRSTRNARTIDQFYVAKHCLICHDLTYEELCETCTRDPQASTSTLALRINEAERRHSELQRICRSCSAHNTALDADSACVSLDCPVFYARLKANQTVRLSARWKQSSLLSW
ncbi:hypothetical protein DFJ77DRAFT_480554 [Powellomyces hirtus]|nr:hypothetical protein DFJ77DRAFT_480554 [Powellomyces hirtus]